MKILVIICELVYLFSPFGFKKGAHTLSNSQKISPDFLINHLKLQFMSNFLTL